jgi:Arm domain-containing DNA-binding protein
MKLTDMTLQKLPKPERGAKLYSDDTLPSFGVKVTQGGAKSFVLTLGRERQRITLGRYQPGVFGLAQARERAKDILAARRMGVAPKPSPTFEVVREEYLGRRDSEVRRLTRQADGYLFKLFDALAHKRRFPLAFPTPNIVCFAARNGQRGSHLK